MQKYRWNCKIFGIVWARNSALFEELRRLKYLECGGKDSKKPGPPRGSEDKETRLLGKGTRGIFEMNSSYVDCRPGRSVLSGKNTVPESIIFWLCVSCLHFTLYVLKQQHDSVNNSTVCSLHFTLGLQSAFYTQSAFYARSAVRCLRFTLTTSSD